MKAIHKIKCQILSLVFWLVACPLMGQVLPKKDLTPADYHLWASVYTDKISEKGTWLSYNKKYDSKRDTLFLVNTNTKQSFSFAKGYNGNFSAEKFFACLSPRRELKITDLKKGTQQQIPDVETFGFANEKLIIQFRDKESRSWVEVKDLNTDKSDGIENAIRFSVSPKRDQLLIVKKDNSVWISGLNKWTPTGILGAGSFAVSQVVWNENGNAMAFSAQDSGDGNSGEEIIWHYNVSKKKLSEFQPKDTTGFPGLMKPSCSAAVGLSISDEGSSVFFGLEEKQKQDVSGEVQVWNSTDNWIYPDRIKNDWGASAKVAMWEPQANIFRQLTSTAAPMLLLSGNQKLAVTYNPMERQKHSGMYEKTTFYITDLQTGEKSVLLNNQPADVIKMVPSPDGKYILYFRQGQWVCYEIAGKKHINLTLGLNSNFADNADNAPGELGCWGFAGWSHGDRSVFLYDEFDLWEIAPGKSAMRITSGREKNVVYRMVKQKQPYWKYNFNGLVSPIVQTAGPVILEAFNKETKESGLSVWSRKSGVKPLVYENAQIKYWAGAAGKVIYSRERFDSPRELKSIEADSGKMTSLLKSNLQHTKYHWGHAQPFTFKSGSGKDSKAVLYYPANYDAAKKYPMVVNIYEQLSDEINVYVNPSELNYTGFNKSNLTTQGYFVLQPDIEYERNNPGPSALDYVTAAAKAVIAKGLVEEKKIGLIGHSFGGYEANFIITQTDLFATAVSGAAVADLTRFYLSVDFGIGYSQAYHFENQQWRMEKSLFEDRPAYDRNNPINFVQNVTTPLLSWTGEKDDHADWQQSIEFHLALRRLGKTNTLLLYPGDDHTINDPAHQQDLTRKVTEWFGYYLKEAKAPEWIKGK